VLLRLLFGRRFAGTQVKRIAIIGASGFLGSTLVEQLSDKHAGEVIPFIHRAGNAWRVARLGMQVRMLDLLDPKQVSAALRGVTHVVNCSRGGNDVMLTGLSNLLTASKSAGVVKFIHVGSVAVYGDPPPLESVRESAPTLPEKRSYGWMKLQQDRIVQNACKEGLPGLILCPPNISGPYSVFLIGLVEAIRDGAFALLDDGSNPCNLVDVRNLCRAIELALSNGPINGAMLFITDDEDTQWRDVITNLLVLTERHGPLPTIGRDELFLKEDSIPPRPRIVESIKFLASSEVRQILRKDPFWQTVDTALRRGVAHLGSRAEHAIRGAIEGPIKVPKVSKGTRINMALSKQQLRNVRHSPEFAKSSLGYRPSYTGGESMAAFRAWYRHHHGMDSPEWPLLQQLS
jgi:nucleoside-diphosphate-sugar epimerase